MAYRGLYIKRDDGQLADLVVVVPTECGTDLGENNPTQMIKFVTDVLTAEGAEVFTVDFGKLEYVTDQYEAVEGEF
jgi:hypothetical protein